MRKLTEEEKRKLKEKIQEASADRQDKMLERAKQLEAELGTRRAALHFLGIKWRVIVAFAWLVLLIVQVITTRKMMIVSGLSESRPLFASLFVFGMLLVVAAVMVGYLLAGCLRWIRPSTCPECDRKRTLRRTGKVRKEGGWWNQRIYDEYQCPYCRHTEWKGR